MGARFEKSLPVKLTEKELRGYGDELALKDRLFREKEAYKKLMDKQIKNELDELDAARKTLATKIESGSEYRMVECEEVMDIDTGLCFQVRLDTGAEIYRRTMNQEEKEKARQKELFNKNPSQETTEEAEEGLTMGETAQREIERLDQEAETSSSKPEEYPELQPNPFEDHPAANPNIDDVELKFKDDDETDPAEV